MEAPSFSQTSVVIAKARNETLIGGTPLSSALQDGDMYGIASDVNNWFVNWPYAEGMRGWKYLRAESNFRSYNQSFCTSAVAANATSVPLNPGTDSGFSVKNPGGTALGCAYFKSGSMTYDFFTYQNFTSDTLTSANQINISHTQNEEVHLCYPVPSDYGKLRFLALDNVQYMYVDPDLRQIPYAGQITEKYMNDGTYSGVFLVLPYAIGTHDGTLYYMQKAKTLTTSMDLIQAPDGNGRRAFVEKMKAHIWSVMGEMDLAGAADALAEKLIDRCASEWATHTTEMNNSLSLYF